MALRPLGDRGRTAPGNLTVTRAVLLLACMAALALAMAPMAAEARSGTVKASLMVRGIRGQVRAAAGVKLAAAASHDTSDDGDDDDIKRACTMRYGGADVVQRRGSAGWRRVVVNTNKDAAEVMKELADDGFEVEADVQARMYWVPNDELWGDIADNMNRIQAPQAWDLHTEKGASGNVTVCVIDTGIDFEHSDLRANMHPALGYNAVSQREGVEVMDTDGHGTHCSGTIAGVGNNGRGVAGVAWDGSVNLLGCSFLPAGRIADAAECLKWCREKGARITSNSWGGEQPSKVLRDEMQAYEDWGGLFVVASGNSNADVDVVNDYPGYYNLASMITVNAIQAYNNKVPQFTNYGANSTHLFAPGVDVASTYPRNRYAYLSGTSMAAPHVAGAAALLWSFRPDLNASQVKALLLDNVDTLPELQPLCRSGGVLNVHRALQAAHAALVKAAQADGNGTQPAPGFFDSDYCYIGSDGVWQTCIENFQTQQRDCYFDADGWCSWWFAGEDWTQASWFQLRFSAYRSAASGGGARGAAPGRSPSGSPSAGTLRR